MRKLLAAFFIFIISTEVYAQAPILFNTIESSATLVDEKSKSSTPVTFININEEVFAEDNLKEGTQLEIATNTGTSVLTITRISEYIPGFISVSAVSEDDPGNVFSFTYKDEKLIGLLHESLGENVHFRYSKKQKANYLTYSQPEEFFCGVDHDEMGRHYHDHHHEESEPVNEKEKSDGEIINYVAGGLSSTTIIDVMIVYTSAASALAFINSEGIEFAMSQAMNLSQTALDNSRVPIELRLVHTYKISGSFNQSSGDLLRIFTASPAFNPFGIQDGEMDEIHELRDEYGADLVTLFSEVNDTGGIAWVANDRNGLPDFGFSLNNIRVVDNSYTVAHEFGHNIGNLHSRTQSTQTAPATGGVFQESVGYQDLVDSIATVMAYTTGGLTRVPYFSNPSLSLNGTVLGTSNEVNITNASLSMRKMKNSIASYRKTKVDAPVSSISTNNIEVNLSAGETIRAIIEIENTGSSLLEYEVDFKEGDNILSKQNQKEKEAENSLLTSLYNEGFEASNGFFASNFEAINSWRSFGGPDITISNASPFSGAQHLRVSSTGSGGSKALFGPYISALPFASYRITFYVKVSDTEGSEFEQYEVSFIDGKTQEVGSGIRISGGAFQGLVKNESGQIIYQPTGIIVSSTGYKKVEIDINTAENEINYWFDNALALETPFLGKGISPSEIFVSGSNNSPGTYLDLDNLSINRYANPYPWLTVNRNTHTISPGRDRDIVLDFNSSGLQTGTYTTTVVINTNEDGLPAYEVPITVNFSGVVSNETDPETADQFRLLQNYPNPFNPSTMISFSLPESGDVSLKVYNAIGMEMGTLANDFYLAGQHQVQFDANSLASGIYIYSLEFNGLKQTRKMLLLK